MGGMGARSRAPAATVLSSFVQVTLATAATTGQALHCGDLERKRQESYLSDKKAVFQNEQTKQHSQEKCSTRCQGALI